MPGSARSAARATLPSWASGGTFLSNGASIGLSMGQTSCGLDNNEVAQCWGFNGEMCDGTTTSSGTPAVVQGL